MSIFEILRRALYPLRGRGRVRLDDALKHLQHCEMSGRTPRLESLAGVLGCTPDQAVRLLAELQSAGMVQLDDRGLRLTPAGRERALHLVRAHRLWERFLAEHTGFDEREWHGQAERREHQLSQFQAEQLSVQLGHPTHDPHGDPIPTAEGEWVPQEGIPLPSAEAGQRLQVVHIEDEPAGLFSELSPLGLRPGMEVNLEAIGPERVRLAVAGETHELSRLAAANVAVQPLPPAPPAPSARLSSLRVGQHGRVTALLPACRGAQRRRLQDLGLLPGTEVLAEFASPSGDPVAYRIRGALIALRKEQAELIQVEPVEP